MYVGGIGDVISEEDLVNYFSAYGSMRNAYIIYDCDSKKSRGFGFVEFTNAEEMQKALVNLNPVINGKMVSIDQAVDKEEAKIANYDRKKQAKITKMKNDCKSEDDCDDKNETTEKSDNSKTFSKEKTKSDDFDHKLVDDKKISEDSQKKEYDNETDSNQQKNVQKLVSDITTKPSMTESVQKNNDSINNSKKNSEFFFTSQLENNTHSKNRKKYVSTGDNLGQKNLSPVLYQNLQTQSSLPIQQNHYHDMEMYPNNYRKEQQQQQQSIRRYYDGYDNYNYNCYGQLPSQEQNHHGYANYYPNIENSKNNNKGQ